MVSTAAWQSTPAVKPKVPAFTPRMGLPKEAASLAVWMMVPSPPMAMNTSQARRESSTRSW